MGLFDRLSRRRMEDLSTPTDLGVVSPWAGDNHLSRVVLSDIFGETPAPMTRELALSVPAVSLGRNLLVGEIQRYPLVALDEAGPLATQPTFLYRTSGTVSPTERMAMTVDSLVFYGIALWLVERGSAGQILEASWCPHSDWRIYEGTVQLRVDEHTYRDADESEVLLINAPFDGLLAVGDRTIRGALSTEEAWTGRMRNPIPLIELHLDADADLTQDEAEEYVKAWSKARTARNGAVGLTPDGVTLNVHGEIKPDLYTEGRNAIRTDIGSYLSIPTVLMDGSLATATLNYSTTEGNRVRFHEQSIPFWIAPIEAALSQDNVVPRGTRVRFDRSSDYAAVPNPTGTKADD